MKYFTSKGLIKEEYGRVKLHATIINTKLRDSNKQESTTLKSTRNTQKSGLNRRTSFDAREVIEVRIVFVTFAKMVFVLSGSQR